MEYLDRHIIITYLAKDILLRQCIDVKLLAVYCYRIRRYRIYLRHIRVRCDIGHPAQLPNDLGWFYRYLHPEREWCAFTGVCAGSACIEYIIERWYGGEVFHQCTCIIAITFYATQSIGNCI